MRITQINTRYIGGGGAASIANFIHNSINFKDDMDSIFLYGRGNSNDKNSIKIANEYESYLSAANMRMNGVEFNRKISPKIKQEINKSDIIHLHNLHGYYINYEDLLKYIIEKDKKIIWTLHDLWGITGRCAFTFGCQKWKNGCYACQNIDVYPKTKKDISDKIWLKKKELFNKLNKDKTIIVTPSKWLKDVVKESYLKDFNIEVINNGVEKSNFLHVDKNILRKELNLPLNKKIVLFVAADPNDSRKGLSHILNLLNDVDENIVFVSIGKKIELKNKNLIQLGYKKNREEIYKIYRASDIFAITSIDDNFPTTVLEAFANGLPVIGFDVGGITEQLQDNNGILVNYSNPKSFKEILVRSIYDDKLLSLCSKNSQETFMNKYTMEKFTDRYIDLYKRI